MEQFIHGELEFLRLEFHKTRSRRTKHEEEQRKRTICRSKEKQRKKTICRSKEEQRKKKTIWSFEEEQRKTIWLEENRCWVDDLVGKEQTLGGEDEEEEEK